MHREGGNSQISADTDRVALGVCIILASVFAMAFADAIIKWLSAYVTIWQVFAIRAVFALPCLWFIAKRRGVTLVPKSLRNAVFRSVLLVGAWLTYYAALPLLDLSVAAVVVYTNPIIIVFLSSFVLQSVVTPVQWMGAALGFVGTVVIVQPGGTGFSWAVILPLACAFLYAGGMVFTRARCRTEPPEALALVLNLTFIVTGLAAMVILPMLPIPPELRDSHMFTLGAWREMTWDLWAILAGLGLLSAGYFLGVARAYQIAPPQVIATCDYSYLVFAVLWGVVLFAERPEPATYLGMSLITVAGLMVALTRRLAVAP